MMQYQIFIICFNLMSTTTVVIIFDKTITLSHETEEKNICPQQENIEKNSPQQTDRCH